jgi:hypothetical protein
MSIETELNMLLGSRARPVREPDNLTAICKPTVYKIWEPKYLSTLYALTICYWDSFTFLYVIMFVPHMKHTTHLWESTACYGDSFIFYFMAIGVPLGADVASIVV